MRKRSFIWLLTLAAILSLLFCQVFAANLPAEEAIPEQYAELYPAETGVQSQVRAAQDLVHTALEGKSILFFGDSLTSGYGLSDYGLSWNGMLESRYGMEVTCRSIAGSTFAKSNQYGYYDGGCYEPYVDRQLPEGEYDIIFVEGGGNDWYCGIPIGNDLNSRDPYSFQGAINLVIDRLQAKYPQSLIVFMTSWYPIAEHTGEMEYYEAMTQICARRDIPCYQARDPKLSGIYAYDTDFRAQYFLPPAVFPAGPDCWHLNPTGHTLFLPTIAAWLEEQVQDRLLVSGYYDVKQFQWFAGSVQYVTDTGLMNGVGDHSFAPDVKMSRGMLVTVLYRADGSPPVEGKTHPFADVPGDAYYRDAVCWAYQTGIVNGTDSTHFSPDDNVTRQQMVALLYRYAVTTQLPETTEIPESLCAFTDCAQINTYALEPMAWAVEAGIIQGTDSNTLAPRDDSIRAQVAAVLQRYFTYFIFTDTTHPGVFSAY